MTVPNAIDIYDIYDIGIAIERNGVRFYEEAAAVQENRELAKFFRTLAKWEEAHADLWEELKEGIDDSPQGASPPDSDDQAQLVLQATADNYIFVKNTNVLSQILQCETIEDVLQLAMAFEKNSLDFYTILSETTSTQWAKGKFDDLIQEEQQHIAMIQEKFDDLS